MGYVQYGTFLGAVLLAMAANLTCGKAETCECEYGLRGKLLRSNVIGGTAAEPGEYEFIASLRYPEGAFTDGVDVSGDHYCGGVLIAKNIVMTAGHCVRSPLLKKITVDVNRYMRDGDDEGRFVSFNTVETRIHPNFSGNVHTSDYDVALLVLDGETDIEPVPILEAENCYDYTACVFGTVLGWGRTVQGDASSGSDALHSVTVPIIAKQACRAQFKTKYTDVLISDAMVCAGDFGRDACRKDSGGPLIVKGKVGGIVSWGVGCGGAMPGVYANVPFVSSWINAQVADINKAPTVESTPAPPPPNPRTSCRFILGRWLPTGCASV